MLLPLLVSQLDRGGSFPVGEVVMLQSRDSGISGCRWGGVPS